MGALHRFSRQTNPGTRVGWNSTHFCGLPEAPQSRPCPLSLSSPSFVAVGVAAGAAVGVIK